MPPRPGKWTALIFHSDRSQACVLIAEAGLTAFRHFNASLLSSLRVPLKVIQERLGDTSAGSLMLDIYMHTEWQGNVEAAKLAGKRIEEAVSCVSLAAIQEKGLPVEEPEALRAP